MEVAPTNVMVSTGAKQCIMNAILSLVDHDQEVIIPLPYWVSYSEMVNFAGVNVSLSHPNLKKGLPYTLKHLSVL